MKNAGFTLIEFMICIFIIGLITFSIFAIIHQAKLEKESEIIISDATIVNKHQYVTKERNLMYDDDDPYYLQYKDVYHYQLTIKCDISNYLFEVSTQERFWIKCPIGKKLTVKLWDHPKHGIIRADPIF